MSENRVPFDENLVPEEPGLMEQAQIGCGLRALVLIRKRDWTRNDEGRLVDEVVANCVVNYMMTHCSSDRFCKVLEGRCPGGNYRNSKQLDTYREYLLSEQHPERVISVRHWGKMK